jgi:hypothetical protein
LRAIRASLELRFPAGSDPELVRKMILKNQPPHSPVFVCPYKTPEGMVGGIWIPYFLFEEMLEKKMFHGFYALTKKLGVRTYELHRNEYGVYIRCAYKYKGDGRKARFAIPARLIYYFEVKRGKLLVKLFQAAILTQEKIRDIFIGEPRVATSKPDP